MKARLLLRFAQDQALGQRSPKSKATKTVLDIMMKPPKEDTVANYTYYALLEDRNAERLTDLYEELGIYKIQIRLYSQILFHEFD